jgi:hypothetical protein
MSGHEREPHIETLIVTTVRKELGDDERDVVQVFRLDGKLLAESDPFAVDAETCRRLENALDAAQAQVHKLGLEAEREQKQFQYLHQRYAEALDTLNWLMGGQLQEGRSPMRLPSTNFANMRAFKHWWDTVVEEVRNLAHLRKDENGRYVYWLEDGGAIVAHTPEGPVELPARGEGEVVGVPGVRPDEEHPVQQELREAKDRILELEERERSNERITTHYWTALNWALGQEFHGVPTVEMCNVRRPPDNNKQQIQPQAYSEMMELRHHLVELAGLEQAVDGMWYPVEDFDLYMSPVDKAMESDDRQQ